MLILDKQSKSQPDGWSRLVCMHASKTRLEYLSLLMAPSLQSNRLFQKFRIPRAHEHLKDVQNWGKNVRHHGPKGSRDGCTYGGSEFLWNWRLKSSRNCQGLDWR